VTLELRRGTVVAADGARLEVEHAGGERASAWADPVLVGACAPGDEVLVNVQARRLGLGSGGFDVVHANLTSGLGAEDTSGAHVMKLNYTSLQHAVAPVEEADGGLDLPLRVPVAVLFLHGQLEPLAWAFAQAAPPGARLAYVQTAGGALPGALSDTVARLRADGLLAAHVTAGPAHGGEAEAVTVAGALHHARQYDAVVAGPGPGILGSGSALGHGGLAALDTAHAALALGAPTLLVARMSEADPRERHRGLSHHTRTVLDLLLAPVTVALPPGVAAPDDGPHTWRAEAADLDAYPGSRRTMGREDPLFFAAALAAGTALAGMMPAAT
jgi:hypothetical protein